MNFSKALKLLKQGKSLRRKGWNGKGMFIKMQLSDESSDMTHDYIYIDTTGLDTDNNEAPKDRVPWIASQTDMLADDWEEKNAGMTSNTTIGINDVEYQDGTTIYSGTFMTEINEGCFAALTDNLDKEIRKCINKLVLSNARSDQND